MSECRHSVRRPYPPSAQTTSGRDVCTALARRGVLAKDTHGATLRLSPPLVATADELALAVDALAAVLTDLR